MRRIRWHRRTEGSGALPAGDADRPDGGFEHGIAEALQGRPGGQIIRQRDTTSEPRVATADVPGLPSVPSLIVAGTGTGVELLAVNGGTDALLGRLEALGITVGDADTVRPHG